ncbi:MAG TPA: SPFH domain-containing protein [Steroidobacteraceae bacterium]|nr:SPFH domain-containing protein [Steroidobacteraceae bacterium]
MSETADNAVPEQPRPDGPPPPPPPGPISQSVAIGFRAVYVAMALLGVLWLASNFRQIAPDSQAVVLRFGRIVRAQQAGLLVAWPRPIEKVLLLPGPDRQLSQEVAVLPPESAQAGTLVTSTSESGTMPRGVVSYLTGDGNIVLLDATLIYRISDPLAYTLSQAHVAPALDRLFRAATVRLTAGRNLNDFLAVATNVPAGGNAQAAGTLRGEVRGALLDLVNARLRELTQSGSPLGIEVQRIDMTAWLPPQAKVAFDAVLIATQAADRGVEVAKTDAEHRTQEANQQRDGLLAAAQATAEELVSGAGVDTARILALEHEETPQTRNSILLREYRAGVSSIMGRVGSETVIDPQGGVRFVLPGKSR